MDYGASINDPEDPAVSPWGNSPATSPHHARTGFAPAASENGSSPFLYGPRPAGLEASGDSAPFPRPGTATTESGTEGGDDEQPATLASSVAESANESHPDASQQARESQAQAPKPPQQGDQPQQQPPAQQRPQFKLQAKITGLERTGKKDPVLRFDIHVCISPESPVNLIVACSLHSHRFE
jgi:hypothetical protein